MNVAALWAMHVAGMKEDGYCGELSPNGQRACVLASEHEGPHDWESVEPVAEEAGEQSREKGPSV